MDIRSAQLFQHLASSLNFSKTSEQMYVSPPTLTRVIQRLEEELGTALFFRDKRSVRLTPAGQRFAHFVRTWLDEWHQLQVDLQLASAELTGEIRLFCTVTASYSHLPAILDRFRLMCPKAEIKLTTGDAASAIEKVRLDEADIALAAHPMHLPANLAFKSIANLPVMLIAPTIPCKVNDLLQQKPIPWDKVPLIMPEHGPARSRFDRWLRDYPRATPVGIFIVALGLVGYDDALAQRGVDQRGQIHLGRQQLLVDGFEQAILFGDGVLKVVEFGLVAFEKHRAVPGSRERRGLCPCFRAGRANAG